MKLGLPDSTAHWSLLTLLSPFHVIPHCQHNTFFDGASAELSSRCTILCFYGEEMKYVISLKAKAVISNGISCMEEDEEELDPLIGHEGVFNPNKLKEIDSRIMKRVREEFDVRDGGFVYLGGFRNVRGVHEWNGLNLEVDETMYDFGTCYEIKCESVEPKKAEGLIEGFLKENGIAYSYLVASKFAIFRSGKLPELPAK